MYNQCMNTNKQPREIRSEFTANGMMAIAPVRTASQQNGWTVGKNFFKPTVARKQQVKNKSFLSRFL